jgi:molecular chaperone DnaK (HSP70)
MQGTVAIDLGSSTTVVAYQPPGEPAQLLRLDPYSLTDPCVVPSLLWLAARDSPRPLLGRQVLEAGLAATDSPQLQRDFKRHIGLPTNRRVSGQNTDALPLSAEESAELLLLQLWQALPMGLQPERLVLTAPIDAYAGYRGWLLGLGERLPVNELALVDEPTAAAIGCGLAPGSTVLVVDLGGGTIDLSLVQLQGGEGRAAPIAQLLRLGGRSLDNSRQTLRCAQVLGKAGLALGGRDLDHWIAAHLAGDQAVNGSLLMQAENLKCQLSDQEQALTVWVDQQGISQALRLDRNTLAQLLERQGLFQQLDGLLEQVLAQGRRVGVGLEHINAVLPVGGTSRLHAIQAWLRQRLSPIPLHHQRPVEAVALGALALTPGVRVRDVLSRGVALRCWDRRSQTHHWHPLFVAGQSWPTDQPLEVVLACSSDNQQALQLVLGEPDPGQRAEVVYVDGLPVLRQRPAGSPAVTPWAQQPLTVPLGPPGKRGVDRLRLRFAIDAHSQLTVAIEDLNDPHCPPTHHPLGSVR